MIDHLCCVTGIMFFVLFLILAIVCKLLSDDRDDLQAECFKLENIIDELKYEIDVLKGNANAED